MAKNQTPIKGAGKPKKVEPTSPYDDEAGSEGRSFMIPPPEAGFIATLDLPNARANVPQNVRTVKVRVGETQDQAIDRVLHIPTLMKDLQASAPGVMPPLQIGEWDRLPAWLKTFQKVTGLDGKDVFRAIIDGNLRTMGLQSLVEKFPNGHPLEVKSHDTKGDLIISTVHKTYDETPVLIYRNLSEDQFRQLQAVSFNRQGLLKGDVARLGMELIQRDPLRTSEADVYAHIGANDFRVLTLAVDPHYMCQELGRAAMLTKDISELYIDYKNNEPGVHHPTGSDLRKPLMPCWKAEYGSFDGGKFTRGKFWDPDINPRSQTADEVAAIWAKWSAEQAFSAGIPVTLEGRGAPLTYEELTKLSKKDREKLTFNTPDKISEFLAAWNNLRGQGKQARKAATVASQSDMEKISGSMVASGAQFTASLIDSLRGAPNSPDRGRMIDLLVQFEAAGKAALQKYEPDVYIRFKAEFVTLAAQVAAQAQAK